MNALPSYAPSTPLRAAPPPSLTVLNGFSEKVPLTMPDGEENRPRWGDTAITTDSWRREMRELIAEARGDFRERFTEMKSSMNELKSSMNDRLGPMERSIGELRAGKADRAELEGKADKLSQTVVYGFVGVVLLAFATVVTAYFIRAPAGQPTDPPAAAAAK
jgi:hypothetical protein